MVNSQWSTVNSQWSMAKVRSSLLTIFVFCLLSFAFCHNAMAQQANDSLMRPRVGVVLSGGGAKGFAHIGALKVIE
jgi:NTE family protein